MRYTKLLTMAVAAAALALSTTGAKAQDYYRDSRRDHRDLPRDYARADRLRADIVHDQRRLNEDLRYGRPRAAEREARDIARDERALRNQMRDIHRDRQDLRRDYRGW